MRYADYAYVHACDRPKDPDRGAALDSKAQAEGYASTPDYIDNVQGRDGTRSFETSDGRTCWSNQDAGLYGWNNGADPKKSTVVPSRNPDRDFENQKDEEADRQGLDSMNDVQENGSIAEDQRQVEDKNIEQGSSEQGQVNKPQSASLNAPKEQSPPETQPQTSFPPPPPPPPPPKSQEATTSQGRGR